MAYDLLLQDIKYLKGVGPSRAKVLDKELKVKTFRDLLFTFPYKYIDRSVVHAISELQEGMPFVQLKGKMLDWEIEGEGRKRRLKAVFTDGTGYIELVWFNGIKYIEKNYKLNQTYLLLGRPASWNGRFSFAHPELENEAKEAANCGRLQPHYHTTESMKRTGFTSKVLAELVGNLFAVLDGRVDETLPEAIISQHGLVGLYEALQTIHHPDNSAALPPATKRLKFEELFYVQLHILRYAKSRLVRQAGFSFPRIGDAFMRFYNDCLPFPLTDAQQRVIKEIRQDMGRGQQMNRLLQGDVGSGKTLVALMCCLIAIDNGYQSCIMAPTEILAEQHLVTLRKFIDELPITVELLTGSVTGAARRNVLERLVMGQVDILVGTHALIEPTVKFHNLGFVVVDEQHRFGVKQRAVLWEKNVRPPHILVMTATPIPRTLAMTVYGDLDVSVIDQLPPGRKPVRTLHYTEADRSRLIDGMRSELTDGRQVYVVFPLIEESEKTDMKNLETGFKQLQAAFPMYKVGMVHGKMKPSEKDEAMRLFHNGETRLLVSTTVIEVGVNVPNASVMVIEDADRFGLAQLHQLRGRVGRGADQSYCLLVTKSRLSETTRRRMQIMTETTDGFVIAEEDLKLRGPGDLEGTAQSGLPFELKIAHPVTDVELMATARKAAAKLLEQDPNENLPQNAMVWRQLRELNKNRTNFAEIS